MTACRTIVVRCNEAWKAVGNLQQIERSFFLLHAIFRSRENQVPRSNSYKWWFPPVACINFVCPQLGTSLIYWRYLTLIQEIVETWERSTQTLFKTCIRWYFRSHLPKHHTFPTFELCYLVVTSIT